MTVSGSYGTNFLLRSMAATRIKEGMISGAEVKGKKGEYYVNFVGPSSEWNGEPFILSSAREPYQPKAFKSLDGAMSAIQNVGLTEAIVKVVCN